MDKELFDDILKSIELRGSVDEASAEVNPIIVSKAQVEAILSFSSGRPRIKNPKAFSLILNVPSKITAVERYHIRCCLCNKVISFPAWYYEVKYAITNLHYFVCFDSSSPLKPTTRCYRRT